MADDVVINKTGIIQRCVARAREEYEKEPETFANDVTRQDAAILNIQRACEAALSLGHHLIYRERLGVPQGAREVFDLLARGGWIENTLAAKIKSIIGFRNIVLHDYHTLQLPVTVAIITNHLEDLLDYAKILLLRG